MQSPLTGQEPPFAEISVLREGLGPRLNGERRCEMRDTSHRGYRNNDNPENEQRSCSPRGWPVGKAILGLGVLAIGVLLTLGNLEIVNVEHLFDYWPVLLILLGLAHLIQPGRDRRLGAGLLWLIVGTLLLLNSLDFWTFNIWDLWPLLLVLLGAQLLWRAMTRGRRQVDPESSSFFDATAVMGGVERHIACDDFQGGDATAMLGGCEIDLTECGSEGRPAEIHIFAFWGGVDIRVPRDWEVQVRGTAIMGAFEDKTRGPVTQARKVLIVRGLAIMGGAEIKN